MIKYEIRGRQISGKKYKEIKAMPGVIEEKPRVEPGTGKKITRLVNQYGITEAVKIQIENELERIKRCGRY